MGNTRGNQQPGRLELAILITFCALLFVSCLLLFTRHNSFPYYCHADEFSKVKQLFTRDFNFNHPQLMLLSVDIVRRALGQSGNYQQVVMIGRWVSATFAAISVVLLTLLGWKVFRLLGAWCVGLSLAVCPIIGVTAHFLKEDATLLLGFSTFLLMLVLWFERTTKKRLIGLGLACGMVVSAKYIGIVCLLPAIVLVLMHHNQLQEVPLRRRLVLLFLSAVLVFAVINFPLFSQFNSFIHGITNGSHLVVHGRKQVALPNLQVIKRLGQLYRPVLLLASVSIFTLIAAYRRPLFVGWVLFVTGVVFSGMLLMTPLGVPDRYLLLSAVSLYALAGLGIAMFVNLASRGRGFRTRCSIQILGAVAAIVLAWGAAPVYRSAAIDAFYQADARAELIGWVNKNLGPDVKCAASLYARLPGTGEYEPVDPTIRFKRKPLTIMNVEALNMDDLKQMRREGISYLILRKRDWKRCLARLRENIPCNLEPMPGLAVQVPEVVWRTPKRFKSKNRWLRQKLVVVQL